MAQKTKKSKKKVTERWIRTCPNCGSTDVITDDKAGNWKFAAGTAQMYNCRKCGFRSPLFPEMKPEELKNMSKKNVHSAKILQRKVPLWVKIAAMLIVLSYVALVIYLTGSTLGWF